MTLETAIFPQAALAYALATAIMVLGIKQGLALTQNPPGCEALLFTEGLELRGTTGFAALGVGVQGREDMGTANAVEACRKSLGS